MVSTILPLTVADAIVRKRGRTILGPVDVALQAAGLTIVMGPNGSGKTTLLRLMHGLERPRGGTVTWNVDEIEARKHQALVFQTPIIMRRSVTDNIAYSLTCRGQDTRQARAQAGAWIERIGLPAERNALVLSGGERQKLAIARGLIAGPQVLFLDEPTTNLDGRSTREIEDLLVEAHRNGTKIVMTTHNIGQAQRLATDVIFLNKGQIGEQAPADQFFSAPRTEEARAFLRGDIVE